MATQTIQSWAVTGETLTMKVYTYDSDTPVDTAAASESANRKGLYTASFTDLPTGNYIVQLETAGGTVRSFFWVITTSATATFQAYEIPDPSKTVLAGGDIDGYSLEEALKICASILAGKVSGAGTTEITFRSVDDTADRVVATVIGQGNRTAVTIDVAG